MARTPETISDGLHVCIDDTRSLGQINIQDPRIAIATLRRLLKQISVTYWDNDMGFGWEYEGRNLLKQFLQDCKNAKHYPHVQVVTSNSVARDDMYITLGSYGYRPVPNNHNLWQKA